MPLRNVPVVCTSRCGVERRPRGLKSVDHVPFYLSIGNRATQSPKPNLRRDCLLAGAAAAMEVVEICA